MTQNQLKLKISNINQKLKANFPKDSKGDLEVIFKQRVYNLQKAYLRMNSQYFKEETPKSVTSLQIKQDFQDEAFDQILSTLFGYQLIIQRSQILRFYFVIRFLKIQCLLSYLRKDLFAHIQYYDVFEVISIADKTQDQQLFYFCFEQLQKQKYQQIIYHQHGLLHMQLSLFKLIIKSHNQFKKENKSQISIIKINELIQQYGTIHDMSTQECRQIKFEVFDFNNLSSEEYKQIFVFGMIQSQQSSQDNKKPSLLESLTFKQQKKSSFTLKLHKSLKNSKILGSIEIKSQNQLKLQMLITFLNKKTEQLKNQNDFLTQQLQNIKKITSANQDIHKQMQKDIRYLKQQLIRKQNINQQHRRIINKLEPLMVKLQREIEKKTQQIDKLVAEHQKKSTQRSKIKSSKNNQVQKISQPIPKTPEEDVMVQSQFLSANFIHQMFSGVDEQTSAPKAKEPVPKIKNKNSNNKSIIKQQQQKPLAVIQSIDDDEIQQLYSHRIQLSQEPVSISKIELAKLCKMVANDFHKKQLKLIYRRSNKKQAKGSKQDLKCRHALLILINTQFGKHIGGYISKEIIQYKDDYLGDENAFIFSLTQNKKMPINQKDVSTAIYLKDKYLISFSDDLMIANDCLTEKSNCFWPSSYTKIDQNTGAAWFAGKSQFLIHDLDIYEINNVEMEMVL